jgi:chorismate mutase
MTKRRLKEVDRQLKIWDDLLDKNAIKVGAYDRTIAKLRQERAELVAKIGSTKCRSNMKK